eukprot:m51a1_g8402 putative adenylate cyclase (1321) ;mRNA; r:236640-240976
MELVFAGPDPPRALTSDRLSPFLLKKYRAEVREIVAKKKEVTANRKTTEEALTAATAEREALVNREALLQQMMDMWASHVQSEGMAHERKNRSLQMQLDEAARGSVREAGQRAQAQCEAERQKTNVAAARAERAKMEERMSHITKQITELRATLQKLQSETAQGGSAMERQLDSLRSKNDFLRREVAAANTRLDKKSEDKQLAEQQLGRARAEIAALGKQIARSQRDRERAALMRKVREAPSGVVTVVFLNIEGSQELWEEFPGAMIQVQQLQTKLVRDRLSTNSGYEARSDGEAFMLCFPTALAAVCFCVDVQESMLSIEWPPSLLDHPAACERRSAEGQLLLRGPRIMVGMCSGRPETSQNPQTGRVDYTGPVVLRAARVSSIARDGAILATEDCRKEFKEHIDERKISVFARGTGQKEEETIYEVLPRSLASRARLSGDLAESEESERAHAILMRQLSLLSHARDVEALRELERAAADLDTEMRASKEQNRALSLEMSDLQSRAVALKALRRKLRAELATEESIRVDCQRRVIKGAAERVEKNAVLEDAREAIACAAERQAAAVERAEQSGGERDAAKELLVGIEMHILMNEAVRTDADLTRARDEVRRLENELGAVRESRAAFLEKLAALQAVLQAADSESRQRDEQYEAVRFKIAEREAEVRAGQLEGHVREIHDLEAAADVAELASEVAAKEKEAAAIAMLNGQATTGTTDSSPQQRADAQSPAQTETAQQAAQGAHGSQQPGGAKGQQQQDKRPVTAPGKDGGSKDSKDAAAKDRDGPRPTTGKDADGKPASRQSSPQKKGSQQPQDKQQQQQQQQQGQAEGAAAAAAEAAKYEPLAPLEEEDMNPASAPLIDEDTVLGIERKLAAERVRLWNQEMRQALEEARRAREEADEHMAALESAESAEYAVPLTESPRAFTSLLVKTTAEKQEELERVTREREEIRRQLADEKEERDAEIQKHRERLRQRTLDNLNALERARAAQAQLRAAIEASLEITGLPAEIGSLALMPSANVHARGTAAHAALKGQQKAANAKLGDAEPSIRSLQKGPTANQRALIYHKAAQDQALALLGLGPKPLVKGLDKPSGAIQQQGQQQQQPAGPKTPEALAEEAEAEEWNNFEAMMKAQALLKAGRLAFTQKPADAAPGAPGSSTQYTTQQLETLGRMLWGQMVTNQDLLGVGLPAGIVFENDFERRARTIAQVDAHGPGSASAAAVFARRAGLTAGGKESLVGDKAIMRISGIQSQRPSAAVLAAKVLGPHQRASFRGVPPPLAASLSKPGTPMTGAAGAGQPAVKKAYLTPVLMTSLEVVGKGFK